MKYLCTNCNYIYDEAFGDEKEGLNPGTLFTELEYDFCCPNCGETKDYFMEIKEEILQAENPNFLSPLEKIHVPQVQIVDNKAIVNVGKIEHPMIESHHIYSISLYDEYGDLVEEKLLNIGEKPKAIFDISQVDDFEVRAKCNLDGLWSSGLIKRN